jgi:MATE family multidrug resistance protein
MMKELTPLLKIDVHRSQAIPEDAPHHSIRCYITSANSTTKRNDDDISEEAQRLLIHKSAVDDEFEHIVKLALPVIATTIIETFPSVVTFLFVGHIASPIAEEQIAAASLSILFLNVTGLSTAFGLASALDTLCSQAYGAGNAIRIGVYLQTGMIVLSIVFFVAWLLNFYISEILQLLGQPMAVAQLAGDFSRYLLPGVPFVYLYELLKRVLQAQNIASPMVYVAILANIISLSTGYYLCFHTSLGFLGAAVSKSLSIMCYPILLLPYMVSSGLMTPIWTGFQWKKAFEGVPEFLALGIPGMLQTCFEW